MDGALGPVVAAHPEFRGAVLRPEQQHLGVQQAGWLLPSLIGVGRDVFVVDVDAPALIRHGGQCIDFRGRVQVDADESVLVADGPHQIGSEQGGIDGPVADAGLQPRRSRQRRGQRRPHTRRRPGR
jgi:hypothetical protein